MGNLYEVREAPSIDAWPVFGLAQVHTHRKLPVPVQWADGAPAFAIQMLDGFHLWRGQSELGELPSGKVGSLLKLLLLHRRRALPRARLCALYWPDADAAVGRNNLNVSLHKLRRLLGDAAQIRFADDAYQILFDGEVWMDVEHFEWLADQGAGLEQRGELVGAIAAYDAAARLYQCDLSPDPEADLALAHWVQSLRGRLSRVLTRLADLQEGQSDHHACLHTALRSLQLDECNESAHRQLMRCYSRLHQPQAVERQYRHCVTVLRQQLGVAPSAETTALYRSLVARLAA